MGTIGKETACTAQRVPFTFVVNSAVVMIASILRIKMIMFASIIMMHSNEANTRTNTKNNENTCNSGSGSNNNNNETNGVLILTTPAMTLTAL